MSITIQKPMDGSRIVTVIKRVLFVIANILLIGTAVATLFVSNASNILRNSLKDDTMDKIAERLSVSSHDTTMDEWIVLYFEERYDEEYLEEFVVNKDSVAAVIDNTDFASLVSKKLKDYARDILHNTHEGAFTSDEFMDFVADNIQAIGDATEGRYYTERDIAVLRDYFESIEMFDDLTAEELCRKIGISQARLSRFASMKTSVLHFVFFASSLLLLIVLHRKKIYRALLCSGILCAVCGIAIIVFRFLFTSLSTKLAHRIGMGASLIASIEEPVTDIIGTTGILWIAVGIILSAGAYLSRSILPSRTR